jgi:hypothetical protein
VRREALPPAQSTLKIRGPCRHACHLVPRSSVHPHHASQHHTRLLNRRSKQGKRPRPTQMAPRRARRRRRGDGGRREGGQRRRSVLRQKLLLPRLILLALLLLLSTLLLIGCRGQTTRGGEAVKVGTDRHTHGHRSSSSSGAYDAFDPWMDRFIVVCSDCVVVWSIIRSTRSRSRSRSIQTPCVDLSIFHPLDC